MSFRVPAIVFMLIAWSAAAAQPLRFGPDSVGAPFSMAAAELYQPNQAGPHPGVVVLHGCNGVGRHERLWGQQLAAWGYVALVVDSFRPRGVTTVCNEGMLVPPRLQAQDAFAAAAYLRSHPGGQRRPYRRDRLLAWRLGGLEGGAGRVGAADGDAAVRGGGRILSRRDPPTAPLETDTLILIGEADDWTPAQRCERWVDLVQRTGHVVQLKGYPGALHAFDAPSMPHYFAGHYIGRDPVAATEALSETKRFLDLHLRAH